MEIYRPEDAFGMNLQTFKLFGVWPSSVKHPLLRLSVNLAISSLSTVFRILIYNVYGYSFQLFYIVALLPTQFINIYLTRNNVQKVADSSFFTLTCVGYVTKLVVLILRREEVEGFFKRLHHPIFAPRRKEHLAVLKDYTNVAKASSMTFMVLSMITCASWIIFPLVDSSQNKVLLFAAWYPFNVTEKPTYGYIYAFQTLLLLTTASMDSMIDMMTTNFYVVMVAQLEILKRDFKQLADIVGVNILSDPSCEFPNGTVTADKKLASNHQERRISNLETIRRHSYLQAANSPEDTFSWNEDYLEKTLNERIAKCTQHYEAILDFVNDVTELFEIGIVVQVCASSIIICVTCLEMTMISPNTMQFYVMIQYCMCMMFQIFIYTWRGNDVTLKTDELREAVYECAWPSIPNKKFRKSLCIIMSRLQVPVKLYIGCFFLLSVNTFFKIMRMAYSFFILLKQVHVSKE